MNQVPIQNEVVMPTEKFSLIEAMRIYAGGSKAVSCKRYIMQYFYPLSGGGNMVWDGSEFHYMSKQDLKDVYLVKCGKPILTWYLQKYLDVYTTITEVNAPKVDKKKLTLNMFAGFKHKQDCKYEDFTKDVKDNVEIFLDYIKRVICGNNEKQYIYFLLLLAVVCKGGKCGKCPFLNGPQGIGKSFLITMLKYYLLGEKICITSGTDPITTPYNEILNGKILVIFEELPVFSTAQWEGVSSKLKEMITGSDEVYANKHVKPYKGKNINNYLGCSNHYDSIKDSQGRRYLTLDLSTERKDDLVYYDMLDKKCLNDIVGKALFIYLREIDTSKWNLAVMPDTDNKLNALADRVPPPYRFIKECYVLQKKPLYHTPTELHNDYKAYVLSAGKKYPPLEKNEFIKRITEIGILQIPCTTHNKKKGVSCFHNSWVELNAIATKNQWISKHDEYVDDGHQTEDLWTDELKEAQLEIQKLKQDNAEIDILRTDNIRLQKLVETLLVPKPIKTKVIKKTKVKVIKKPEEKPTEIYVPQKQEPENALDVVSLVQNLMVNFKKKATPVVIKPKIKVKKIERDNDPIFAVTGDVF